MKIYDKRIYKINECIRVVIIVIVCFMIGYVCGILAGDKSEELKNKDIDLNNLTLGLNKKILSIITTIVNKMLTTANLFFIRSP